MNNLALAGVFLVGMGLLGLRVVWRNSATWARFLRAASWLLLIWAVWLCSQAWGAEFGVSYAMAGIALVGWLLVLANGEVRAPKQTKSVADTEVPTPATQKWLTFIAAGPVAGMASCQLTLVCTYLMPITDIARMATAALLFPLAWAVSMTIICMLDSPGRHAIVLVIISVLFSFPLYL